MLHFARHLALHLALVAALPVRAIGITSDLLFVLLCPPNAHIPHVIESKGCLHHHHKHIARRRGAHMWARREAASASPSLPAALAFSHRSCEHKKRTQKTPACTKQQIKTAFRLETLQALTRMVRRFTHAVIAAARCP